MIKKTICLRSLFCILFLSYFSLLNSFADTKAISEYYPGFQLREERFNFKYDHGHIQAIIEIFKKEKNLVRVFEYLKWAGVKPYTNDATTAQEYQISYIGENPEIEKVWKAAIDKKDNSHVLGITLVSEKVNYKNQIYSIDKPSIIIDSKNISFRVIFHEFLHFLVSQYIKQNTHETLLSNLEAFEKITLETNNFYTSLQKIKDELQGIIKELIKHKKKATLLPGELTLDDYNKKTQVKINDVFIAYRTFLNKLYDFSKSSILDEVQIEKISLITLPALGVEVDANYLTHNIEEFYHFISPIIDDLTEWIITMAELKLTDGDSIKISESILKDFNEIRSEIQKLRTEGLALEEAANAMKIQNKN